MPDIFLDLRRVDYRSEQNIAMSAWRPCAEALFFLADNDLRLVLDGSGGGVVGYLSVP
jgi:hypothetical protein